MAQPQQHQHQLTTRLLHADHEFEDQHIGPALAVSTTYRYKPSSDLRDEDAPFRAASDGWDPLNPGAHYYSRYTTSNSTRVEKIIGDLHNGFAIAYSSGLAASFSALVHLKPKRLAIRDGYMGVHQTIKVYRKINPDLVTIDLDDEYKAGDIVWLETPLNPTGEVRDIAKYAKKIHAVGGKLAIDSTFAPPPLQQPFDFGADVILHSATKYFGGHSDALAGILVVRTEDEWRELWEDRTYLGNIIGSMEAWLILRSLRTFSLRVQAQSSNATELAQWLSKISATPKGQEYDGVSGGLIERVWHGSLQAISEDGFDPKTQHQGGWGPTFSILLKNPKHARIIPFELKLFTHATSLGGVESLIEQRKMSDPNADERLLRLSVGIEGIEDLKADWRQALKSVA